MTTKNKKLVSNRGCHNAVNQYCDEPFLIYHNNINELKKKMKEKVKKLSITKEESKYKFIKSYYIVKYNDVIIGIIFQPDSCMAYNTLVLNKQEINIANLDTLLHFYFSLILIEFKHIHHTIIYFSIVMLYQIIQKYDEILKTKPVSKYIALRRFNLPCFGNQEDYQTILKTRSQKYKSLKNNKTSKEYKSWFFKYTPRKNTLKNKNKNKNKS